MIKHLDRIERKGLTLFKEKLLSELQKRVFSITLFGSKARGDDHLESDIDLLVLVNRKDRQLRNRIYDIACDIEEECEYRIFLSPLVWDKKQFKTLLKHERKIALDIQKEGIQI